MDEARRSLRFILPGLTAGLVFLVLALASGLLSLTKLLAAGDESPVATIAGALLASGAVGYLGAQLYFFCHWSGLGLLGPVDHRKIADYIASQDPDWRGVDRTPAHGDACRRAWVTVTTWWFLRHGTDARVKSMTERTTSLGDHAHSAGVLCCTIVLAAIAWLSLAIQADVGTCRIVGGIASVIAVVVALYRNHVNTRRMFEDVVDGTVRVVIERPCSRTPNPDE